MRRLEVRDARALDLRELSALTIRRGPDGRSELLAVGDQDPVLVSAGFTDAGAPGPVERHDLRDALRGTGTDRTKAGFEGVAVDGDGTVVLLQEEQARLLVLPPGRPHATTVLDLVVAPDDPVLQPAWHRRPNTRGEGLLLLARGHVLVAKQRDPVCLIEFGPPGDPPLGVAADTLLAPDEVFDREAAGRAHTVLAVWPLTGPGAALLPSLNDLARGPDGRVYALSSDSRVIARLEKRLVPGERARPTEEWRIDDGVPGGHDRHPEGLTIHPSGSAVVGFDTGGHEGVNLVVSEPLDGTGGAG